MTREVNRVTLGLLAAFTLIAISAAFWSVIQSDSLLDRKDNARNVIAEQRIQRGTIYDLKGERLAYSQETKSGVMQRVYPDPEVASAVGYYSLTYGTAGVEAAYDPHLRGDDQLNEWTKLENNALHRSQQGGDVLTTINLDVQRAAAAALKGRAGAVVVIEVPSGRVLALVSQPGYDPNTLDKNWNTLTKNEVVSPLLNRAVAGFYQPGGAFETVVLSAMLSEYPALDSGGANVMNVEAPDAQQTVSVGRLTLTCLPGTPAGSLTLAEAYVYGCPAPFAQAISGNLTPERLWERLGMLGFLDAPRLTGLKTAAGSRPAPFTGTTPPQALEALLVGQGVLTITPLQLAQVLTVIANQGNAVPLHIVEATRPAGSSAWQPVDLPLMQPALMRQDVSAAVRLAMLQAAARSPYVRQALRGGEVLYGHSAIAFGGPNQTPVPHVWFAGFVEPSGNDAAGIVVVAVVENESDPGVAAAVAGAALNAAQP